MADENNNAIIYTINNWTKGQVLTAEKLNASELALKAVIDRVNGAVIDSEGNTTNTVDDAMALVTKQNLNNTIDTLKNSDFTLVGDLQVGNVTTSHDAEIHGDIIATGNMTFGTVTEGSEPGDDPTYTGTSTFNNTAINMHGTTTIDELQVTTTTDLTGNLTARANVEFGTATVVNNVTSYTNTASINANTTINGTTTLQGITAINNNTTITGTVNIGTESNGDYSIAQFNGSSNIIKGNTSILNNLNAGSSTIIDTNINTLYGTTNILNNLTVGTATTQNGSTTYTGTATFNTSGTNFHGDVELLDGNLNLLGSHTTIRSDRINLGSVARPNTFGSTIDYSLSLGLENHINSGSTGTITCGIGNTVSEIGTVAIGQTSTASGRASIAGGDHVIANHLAQYAFGQYNIADVSSAQSHERGAYIEIIGNGTSNNERSNARTLDWSGNEWLSGELTAANLTIGTVTTVDNSTIYSGTALFNTSLVTVNGNTNINGDLTISDNTIINNGIHLNNRLRSTNNQAYNYDIITDDYGFYIGEKEVGQSSGKTLFSYDPSIKTITVGSHSANTSNAVNDVYICGYSSVSLSTYQNGIISIGSELKMSNQNITFIKNNHNYTLTAENVDDLHRISNLPTLPSDTNLSAGDHLFVLKVQISSNSNQDPTYTWEELPTN